MPKAPRICPGDNGNCTNLVRHERYCPDHQPPPWQGRTTGQGSTRAARTARAKCLADAHHRCQLRHPGCTGDADEAHHQRGIADTGRTRTKAVDAGELVAACPHCHRVETREQARRGRNRATHPPPPPGRGGGHRFGAANFDVFGTQAFCLHAPVRPGSGGL